MSVPLWAWLAVLAAILVMLAIDLVAHRHAHVIGVREAAVWSAVWVVTGVGFGALVWAVWGSEYSQQYFAGYLIEKSLAVDNVFVWAIIFAAFAVPREFQHRVLFFGVLGALVFRGIFIAAGALLIDQFALILYVFAAFLIYTGYRMVRTRNEHPHPERSRVLRLFRRLVPMTEVYVGQRFLVRRAGVILATPLLAVLVLVELTDIVFAVDSIPAIFAVTSEPFLVFTANAFAILGLRAMYFLLADLLHRFIYLKLGLAVVLIWVGGKMLLHDVLYIPTTVSLAVIAAVITVSILASLRATRGQGRREVVAAQAGSFRVATDAELREYEPVWGRRRPQRREVIAVLAADDDDRTLALVRSAAENAPASSVLLIVPVPPVGFTLDPAVIRVAGRRRDAGVQRIRKAIAGGSGLPPVEVRSLPVTPGRDPVPAAERLAKGAGASGVLRVADDRDPRRMAPTSIDRS